jgi:hypothetical protein
LIIVILSGEYQNNGSNSFCTMENKLCAYCGKIFSGEGWPHVEGDSNRGVLKIEQFCSEEHKYNFKFWIVSQMCFLSKCLPTPKN